MEKKMVIIEIEDNAAKIAELKMLKERDEDISQCLDDEIDRIQKENFLKILTYVRSMTEDYIAIVKGTAFGKIQLDVTTIARSVRICSCEDGAFVDFNYMGTPKIGPKRMTAKFKGNEIIITASSKEGINDLMNSWKYLKPEFQKKIDEACSKNCKEIVRNQEHLTYLLENAKKFEV